jgi:hypothetical protein
MTRLFRKLVLSVSFTTLALGATFASAQSNLPPVQNSASNTFLTGGIGLDESTAIKGAMNDWPLSLQFAEMGGQRAQYVADVQVLVTDSKGHIAIQSRSDGPFMLANVPPGIYKIAATLAGKTLHQTVEVKSGKPSRITFLWPATNGASQ